MYKYIVIVMLLVCLVIVQGCVMLSAQKGDGHLLIDHQSSPTYVIDFVADPPTIEREGRHSATVTGNVLHQADLSPANIPYTITLTLSGGPTEDHAFAFPVRAGRAPTRFATNSQPEIVQMGGMDALAIRLLGLIGTTNDPAEGAGLTYHRSPSSHAMIALSIGGQLALRNVRYTLAELDMALSEGLCIPTTSECRGSFIDRVTLLHDGETVIEPKDLAMVVIDGNVISNRFLNQNGDGYPDQAADYRVAEGDTQANVTIVHPGFVGPQLRFRFDDVGVGFAGDDDGYHAFDASSQSIGIGSGITFELVALPPLPTPTPNPNLTTISGGVAVSDESHSGCRPTLRQGCLSYVQGSRSGCRPTLRQGCLSYDWGKVEIHLYTLDPQPTAPTMITTTVALTETSAGQFQFEGVEGGVPYRVEARVLLPSTSAGVTLNPLRFLRTITPTVAGPNHTSNHVQFELNPVLLDDVTEHDITEHDLLLPDLQPLTHYPLPADTPAFVKEEIEREYPGLEKWYLDTESQPGRTLLRFGTLAANIGRGPLHIIGGEATQTNRPVYQRIYTKSGAYVERRAGRFVYHPTHDHVHMDAFEQYNLRTIDDNRLVAASSKVSFCLTDVLSAIDRHLAATAPIATTPMGWTCGADEQSINVGYSDYYGPMLPDQWIDVTHVPSGDYWLEVVVDPLNRLRESNEDNNRVRIRIHLAQTIEP